MIAMGFYIVGIAAVLYFRPQLMFHAETGAWKEFGLDSGRSILPFWMFALVWAFVSYVLGTLISVYLTGVALQSLPVDVVEANISNVLKPVSKSPPPSLPTSVAQSVVSPAGTQPGYYVLEAQKTGPPKYVYFGTAPPTIENVAARSA
jgi:hypothetical protein